MSILTLIYLDLYHKANLKLVGGTGSIKLDMS